MLDIGWSEMALIALVAIVVIGPKDLPKVLRAVGQFTAKARSMAREFQSSLDDIAREADVADLKQDISKLAQMDLKDEFEKNVDPTGDLRQSIENVNQTAAEIGRSMDDAGSASETPAPSELPKPHIGPVDADSADPAPETQDAKPATTLQGGSGQ